MSLIPQGTTLTVETKYLPPLVVDLSPAPAERPPGIGGIITAAFKPRVTLALKGQVLARVTPYGDPAPNEWPKVKIGLMIAAALAVFSILRIFR